MQKMHRRIRKKGTTFEKAQSTICPNVPLFVPQRFKREPMTISLGVKKVETLLQRDKDFSKKVETMEMNLWEKSKKKYFITIA